MSSKKKKNKMERGLTNRHVQVMAIAGTIGTGLFLGGWSFYQFDRTFDCTNLPDYRSFYVPYDESGRRNALSRS